MALHVCASAPRGPRLRLSVALLVLPAAAFGAGQRPELLLFEDTPVTAAAKHRQSPRQAPARVTVISREEIERFGYRTLAEALRAVSGLYLSNDRSYDQVGVR
jgi:iron complex outermembrane receptor protein